MIDFARDDVLLGVVGAGAMGQGIVQVALQAGLRVRLHDARPGAAEEGAAAVSARLVRLVEKGRLGGDAVSDARGRLVTTPDLAAFAHCDAVIEAVVEELAVKRQVFEQLEAVVRPDCLLATNTSSLPITSIARVCRHRERIAGMHFFNPVPLMRLVEIVRGLDTCDAAVEAARTLGQRLGRTPVTVKDSPGFLVNYGGQAIMTEGCCCCRRGSPAPPRSMRFCAIAAASAWPLRTHGPHRH